MAQKAKTTKSKASKSTTTTTRKRTGTKSRTPSKPKKEARASGKAIPVAVEPPAPDSVVVVSELRETAEILGGIRGQREEFRAWMAETGESLAELRRQRAAIGDLSELQRSLDEARAEFEALIREAQETRHALEVNGRAREAAAATSTIVVEPASPEVRGESNGVESTDVPARDLLPEVGSIPLDELPPDAPERLVRYLNDAWIIEKEQTDLLQTLADSAEEPEVKAELEAHRILSQDQQQAIRERLRALGVRPSGGRSFLGTIATHVWDAIQTQGRDGDDAVEVLLKATSAVELEAATYLAIYSLAHAIGDEETATLASHHLRQEREFADQLRTRMVERTLRPCPVPVA